MKAFVNYVKTRDPARMLQYQQVLAIRQRKKADGRMVLPGREGLAAILRDPDPSTRRVDWQPFLRHFSQRLRPASLNSTGLM